MEDDGALPVQYASQSRSLASPNTHRNAYPNAGPVRVPTDDGTRCVLGLTGIWLHASSCWMNVIKELSRIASIPSGMPATDLMSRCVLITVVPQLGEPGCLTHSGPLVVHGVEFFFNAYFLEAMVNVDMGAGA